MYKEVLRLLFSWRTFKDLFSFQWHKYKWGYLVRQKICFIDLTKENVICHQNKVFVKAQDLCRMELLAIAVKQFCKKLHFGCLTVFWIHPCYTKCLGESRFPYGNTFLNKNTLKNIFEQKHKGNHSENTSLFVEKTNA